MRMPEPGGVREEERAVKSSREAPVMGASRACCAAEAAAAGSRGGKAEGSRMAPGGALPEAAAAARLRLKDSELGALEESSSSALPQSPVGGSPAAAQRAERGGVLMLAREPSCATQFTVAGTEEREALRS
jgi:hypothetical protein